MINSNFYKIFVGSFFSWFQTNLTVRVVFLSKWKFQKSNATEMLAYFAEMECCIFADVWVTIPVSPLSDEGWSTLPGNQGRAPVVGNGHPPAHRWN